MSSIEACHASQSHSTFDFEGLEESLVDNNEDDDDDDFNDLTGLTDPAMLPDIKGSGMNYDHNLFLIRDALIRDSSTRTEDDIEIIVSFLSIINSNHDHMTRRRLAPHFVLAEIEQRDTRVLTHGEKLDAYCIVAAGSLRHVLPAEDSMLIQDTIGSSVDADDDSMSSSSGQLNNNNNCHPSRHVHAQNVGYLHVGDEFGAHLDDRIVYGEIFTNEDFVWVLCVPHVIFDQICGEKTFKTIRDEVTGNIIEMRANCQLPPLMSSNEQATGDQNVSNQISSTFNASTPIKDEPNALSTIASPMKGQTFPKPNLLDSNELIRATKERLYELLLNSEPNEIFIEDFLLTFRIWAEKDIHPTKDSKVMADLMERMCNNIRNGIHVENCVRIMRLWMVNHFQDFQTNNRCLLDEFENVLKENPHYKTQLRLFYMNLSAKSIQRSVTVTRSDRNSSLPFSLIGGYECTARLFIGEIISPNGLSQQSSTPAVDLRPGDRVISINGIDCHVMPIGRAYELCRSSTHLALKVKYDPHLFYALIEGRHENKRQIVEPFPMNNNRASSSTLPSSVSFSNLSTKESKKGTSTGSLLKQTMRSLVSTTNQLMNTTSNILHNNHNSQGLNTGGNTISSSHSNSSLSLLSNSSLSSNSASGNQASHSRIVSYEVAEIIKIYLFENNECRFLPIHSSTTARECIQLALREFQLQSNYSSRDFALYEYSVIMNNSAAMPDESTVASSTVVKRMSDGTSDLVRNLGLNSRLYLKMVTASKDNGSGGHHLSDSDIAKEILKDSSVNSLQTLDCNSIARELTSRDFRLFCRIEAQQFVYDLAYNGPNEVNASNQSIIFERAKELQEFERKTNEEMFWTINQVLGEKRSLAKRVKAIKQLIRVATLSMKLNNYNTLFAILSGLMHLSVSRLKSCWDRVPTKHMKQLQKLQQLMDPSRNFYNFRQQLMQKLREDNATTIIIPFFPLVKKDLSFIWLANQTYVNSAESSGETKPNKSEMLVNWEKMRLLSEKIREIQKMANTTSLAMAAINGMSNGAGNGNNNNVASPALANEPIDPSILFRIFADSTTNEDPRTFSHKKLWENQRMAKRVQSFLDDTFGSITSDEHLLMSRSYSCELPQTPNANHATTRSSIASTMSSSSQLSHPSPTPSSASSSSNSLSMHSDGMPGQFLHRPHRPRFGQSSPNQLKKLLALSDGAVIVPHHNNSSANNSHHNNNANNGGGANQSTGGHVTSGGGPHHGMHHHPSLYSQHNMTRSSNSSLNSSVSGSTSYYNSFNSHAHHSYGLNGYPNGTSNTANYSSGYVTTNNGGGSKLSFTSHTSHQSFMSTASSSHPSAGAAPPCCCTSQSAGPLFPNQSYCSCFNRSMRPMLMIPQTSGLMHPSCPSCQPSQQPSRRLSTIPFKQPLPVESSSVTSMRKLEEFQQMTRYREQARFASKQSNNGNASRRPQCPDYDTAMQRLCHVGTMKTNGGPGSSGKGILYSHRSRSSSRQQHHREDAV